MTLIDHSDDFAAFFTAALPVWQSDPVAANLQWALSRGCLENGGAVARAFIVSDGGSRRTVGLQTDGERAIILHGSPLGTEGVAAIRRTFPEVNGFIGPPADLARLRSVYDKPVTQDVRMTGYVIRATNPGLARPPGRLRPAAMADLDLLEHWLKDFLIYIQEVGGGNDYRARAQRLIEEGKLFVYVTPDGKVRSMTGSTRSIGGVACINNVFTPETERGKGYSTAANYLFVAELLKNHDTVVLFADQANPASNAVYRKIGFSPAFDTAELIF